MNRDLEDFLYHLDTMETSDLISNALDDVWLADLTDEELIAVIHEMVDRFPADEEPVAIDDWDEVDYEEL